MKKNKFWFSRAVLERPPYTLGGWKKTETAAVRRRKALSSRPKNWKKKTRYLSAGRALQALSNVTKNKPTKLAARRDAKYFFKRAR